MAAVTIINGAKYQSNAIDALINLALRASGESLLITKSVKEILFGYKDGFLTFLKTLAPSLVPTDVVGLFVGKNDTNPGHF
jgi:hypothetical protein